MAFVCFPVVVFVWRYRILLLECNVIVIIIVIVKRLETTTTAGGDACQWVVGRVSWWRTNTLNCINV